MKKTLNVNSLKFQQSTVGVRSLSVYALFFDMCSLKISDLKKKIKKKDLIFVKIDVI